MNEELKYGLAKLEMLGNTKHSSGLIPVQEIDSNKNLPPEEYIALENAKKYKAQYVYFRRFKNRPPVPQVYLYDYTDRLNVDENELTHLHKQLYSSGLVPMFFIFTKQDVRIFNCFDRPAERRNLKYTPLATIKLASSLSEKINARTQEEFKAFSGRSFDNGTFWENSKYSKHFKFSNSAYEKLLSELKQALKDIINKEILPANFARKIMVVSILIKYLEERVDEKGNKVFPDKFFSRFAKAATKFTDVLSKTGAYLELLNYLAKHFNGGIFQLKDDEREFLANRDLSRFGQFLDGEIDGIQFVFWRLYSFNDLPVELISNIYEEFLGKQPGVVYTPPYLVNFLLDEAMPLSSEETNFKILDPACGSGVFLVGAYRRLIYRWRKKNNWDYPDLSVLKKLLRENIFGVELNKEAANLTIFSLSLALCDELTPLQIWKDLKFDNLHKENILHDDFFNVVSKKEFQHRFDLVIGNPPFIEEFSDAAILIDKDAKVNRNGVTTPNKQVSLLFLEQSFKLLKTSGYNAFILPASTTIYNHSQNTVAFRKYLFKKYNIKQVIDFTKLKDYLFSSVNVPIVALFGNGRLPSKDLLHVVIQDTYSARKKQFFEIDTYDFYSILKSSISKSSYIWKVNLLGIPRLLNLINRLSEVMTFGEFLEKKKSESGWEIGEGYRSGNEKEIKLLESLNVLDNLTMEESKQLEILKKKYFKAPYLTGNKVLLNDALTSEGLDLEKSILETRQYFLTKRKKEIFEPPLVLIREVIQNGKIPLALLEERYLYKSQIIGIHAPKNDLKDLKKIVDVFKKNQLLYEFLVIVLSARHSITKATSILKKDILKLPFSKNEEELRIDSIEEILIYDSLKTTDKSILSQETSDKDLRKFSQVYCQILKSVFKSIKPFQHFETDLYICLPFYFGEKPNIDFSDSEKAEEHIEQLIQKNSGVSLRLTRIVRLYEGNIIYLIKPKKLRYWLKSIALRDADETFSDLRKQGY